MTPVLTQEIIEAYRGLATASVADAVEKTGERGYMTGAIGPVLPGKLVGPAVTVLEEPCDTAEPPTLALRAIDDSPAGSVLCIAAGAADVAVFGGLMAAGAVVNGIAGAVLDARVRDIEEIRRDYPQLPIYARGGVPSTTVGRYRTVSLNEPVELGGVMVAPGDLIVGDSDGVVRVSAARIIETLEIAQLIEKAEREQTQLIHESKSLLTGLAKHNRV
ncbi:RraA family protein [Micromonospora sp. NPDC005206]|uniref:RraA family protein n=1 Tax=Micromonospora sp. NPDC005206 TaxID=3157022 RepID=UPI0033BD3B7F